MENAKRIYSFYSYNRENFGNIGMENFPGQQKSNYFYHLLYDYLSGQGRFFDAWEFFEATGLPFKNPYFKVILICCYGASRERMDDMRGSIGRRLLAAGISPISFYYGFEKLIYIVNPKCIQDTNCDNIFCNLSLNFGLRLHCGISSMMDKIQDLPELFMQAEAALKESVFQGAGITQYNQITKESENVLNIADYIKLLDFFNRGMLDSVNKMLEEIFLKLTYRMPSVKNTVSTLFNMLNYFYINLSVIYKDICDIEQARICLLEANTLSEMKIVVTGTIHSMFARFSEFNEINYSNYIINYMINEVRTRYSTKLTLYELADKLAMNYNYISGLFTKKVGMTFQEYLMSYRLDKSRELLLYGTHCMNEIAGECGFYDSKYFGKAYKKRFNMTPAKYRDQFHTSKH
jgi:Transcriptional regulator containing an amidase domain and an AraC-type DNA-binding HTH domain